MPVPSQGNSAGSPDVLEAQVARKCGMQRQGGQAAPRLLSPVCISLAESNVHSSAKAGRSSGYFFRYHCGPPGTTFRPDRPPVSGTASATDLVRNLRSAERSDAVSLGNDQRIRERVTKVTSS